MSVSSISLCHGRAAVCDCGTPWTFLVLCFFVFDRLLHEVMTTSCRFLTSFGCRNLT